MLPRQTQLEKCVEGDQDVGSGTVTLSAGRPVAPSLRQAGHHLGRNALLDRTRVLLSRPGKVAAFLPAVGALAIVSVVPLRHWPLLSLLTLLIVAGIASITAVVRITVGERLPGWTLNVDICMGNLMVTVAVAVGRAQDIHLANLYLLLVVHAVLYLSPRAAIAHFGFAAAAFAVVLARGAGSADPVGFEWMSVFGTAAILGAVTYGLVGALRTDAARDPLTGLANRRSWEDRLEEEMQRSQRAGAALSLGIVDLDDFKEVNDRDGHDAGDRLLQALAHVWTDAIRGGGDFLARIGGDEFAILAPGSDADGINGLIERLRDVSPAGVSWSIGVATWDGTERAQDLMRRADLAMYETKSRHRRPRRHLSI